MRFNLSLHKKILALTLILVVGFSVIVGIYVKIWFASSLTDELLKRGVSIAKHLAEVSANPAIQNDLIYLEYLVKNAQRTEADIDYVFISGTNGKQVLAHSFGLDFPIELLEVHQLAPGMEASTQRLAINNHTTYDIVVPILNGRVGHIHIGISAVPVQQAVDRLTSRALLFLLVLILVSIAIVIPVSRTITRPIACLKDAVDALNHGERDLRVKVSQQDEIGVLTEAFNDLVSNLQHAENQLAAQLNFLEILIDDIPSPVFYKDMQQRMLGCNRAFACFMDSTKENIIGQLPGELYSAEVAALHQAKDEELIKMGGIISYEKAFPLDDGKQKTIIFHKTLFNREDGKPAGIIGVMQDISEQREVDRLKSEFVSTMAHEFQTPLATILGFSELILDKTLDGPEIEKAQHLISLKAEYLSRMVDELLDLSRIEAGRGMALDLKTFDLNQAVREVVHGFSRRTASHKFELSLPEGLLELQADRSRVSQVLDNIMSNAVKYSVAGSRVHIAVKQEQAECRVSVADNGIGMSLQEASCMFEKFYRADNSNTAPPGTGLGMYISRSIVEAHRGTLAVESAPGNGTTVSFSLPLS